MPYVDIDMRHIDTDDLLEELENRYLDEREKIKLQDLLNNDPSEKYKLFMSVMDKYSLLELEEMFKERFTHTVQPKEQLALPLNYKP